jgi:hypothetical protein
VTRTTGNNNERQKNIKNKITQKIPQKIPKNTKSRGGW